MAAAFENLRRGAQNVRQAGVQRLPVLAGEADAQALAVARFRRRPLHAGRIARVVAFHVAQQQAQIGGGARHRPALVEAGRERHHAVAGDPPVGGLEAADAAERGWLPDRTAGVGAGCRRHEASGDGRGGTAGGAAGNAARIPGIRHRTEVARLVGRAHCELVHVGLAQRHRAGAHQALHDRGVVGRDELAEHPRAAGGGDALGAEDVLVRDRHAEQIAEAFLSNGRVRLAGRRQRLFFAHGDEAVAVVAANALEAILSELLGADGLAAQRLHDRADGCERPAAVAHSTTRGTR